MDGVILSLTIRYLENIEKYSHSHSLSIILKGWVILSLTINLSITPCIKLLHLFTNGCKHYLNHVGRRMRYMTRPKYPQNKLRPGKSTTSRNTIDITKSLLNVKGSIIKAINKPPEINI